MRFPCRNAEYLNEKNKIQIRDKIKKLPQRILYEMNQKNENDKHF